MKLVTPKEVEKFIEKTANKYFTKPIEIADNTCIEIRKDIYIYNFDKVAPTGIYLILKSDIEKYQRKIKGMRKSRIKEVAEPPLYLLEMLPSEILHHINRLEDILQLERHKFMLDEHTALTQTELANYALLNHCETDEERVELAKELNKYVESKQKENGSYNGVTHSTINDILRANTKNSEIAITEDAEIRRVGKTDIQRLLKDTSKEISPAAHIFLNLMLNRVNGTQIQSNLEPLDIEYSLDNYLKDKQIENNKENRKYHTKEINKYILALRTLGVIYDGKDETGFINFADAGKAKAGMIHFRIGGTFKKTFLAYKDKETGKLTGRFNFVLPRNYGAIDTRHYQYAPSIYDKLFSHFNSNTGKENENILSVKCLLEYIGLSNENYLSRGIETLENNLNHLADLNFFEWEYCHSKHEPLSDEEQQARLDAEGEEHSLPYKHAINCYINWFWTDENLLKYRKERLPKVEKVKELKIKRHQKKIEEAEKSEKRITRMEEKIMAEGRAKKRLEEEGIIETQKG